MVQVSFGFGDTAGNEANSIVLTIDSSISGHPQPYHLFLSFIKQGSS